MTVKINVGPPVLTINRGSTFMVTDYRGQNDPLQAQGVFADDTRFVSDYRLWINGKPWERISSAAPRSGPLTGRTVPLGPPPSTGC